MTRTTYFGGALVIAIGIGVGLMYAEEIDDDLVVTGDLTVEGYSVSFPNADVNMGGDLALNSNGASLFFNGSWGWVQFEEEGMIAFRGPDSGIGFEEFGGAGFDNGGLLMFFAPIEGGMDAQSGQVSIADWASLLGPQSDGDDPPQPGAFIYANSEAPEGVPIGGTDYVLLNVSAGSLFNIAGTGHLALGDFTAGSGESPPAYSGAFLTANDTDEDGTTLAAFNASTTGGGTSETAPYASMQAMNGDGKLVGSVSADEAAVVMQSLQATEGDSVVRAAITVAPTDANQKPYVALQVTDAEGQGQGSIKLTGDGTGSGPVKVRVGNSTNAGVVVTENGDIILSLGTPPTP